MRGNVSLKDFTADEVKEIAGFLGVPEYQLNQKRSVSLQQFEAQLATTSFSQFTLKELLEEILEEKLQSKEEDERLKGNTKKQFINDLQEILSDLPQWYNQIQKQTGDSKFIWQEQKALLPTIQLVAKAVSRQLKGNDFIRLPILAQLATGDPHAFDSKNIAGKLLVHAVYSLSKQPVNYPKTREEQVDLLGDLKIIQDDLWNFVTFQGLLGYEQKELHPLWQAAVATKSAVNMPMRHLVSITKVRPAIGKRVYIVENSSVASTLMDAHPKAPIICTHGQLRMASWRLLDLLSSEIELYYSGDLDPEGLRIAQHISNRYSERVHLWRMDEACYHLGMTGELTAKRLSNLQSLTILPTITEQMKRHKKVSYQEAWLDLLVADIKI
ncbi:TIGR02679 family protein [Lysinibacillus sp. BF-4]|uniref:TIGR02679 family protein n=1 Tax=Lysinibacillus sp. BF-4 TaxID=1473546 RepID=UPI002101D3F6|nr:TIGR02679 family protein [Lysinibacillus sp. BF-4]